MHSALFFLTYLGILCLPGLALWTVFRQTQFPVLASVAVSYMIFVIVFAVANHLAIPPTTFAYIIAFIVASSALLLIAFRHNIALEPEITKPLLLIIGSSVVYQIVIGAFVEIPADIYAHLERFQSATRDLENGTLGRPMSWKSLLLQRSGVFYYVVAFANTYAHVPTRELIELVDFANRTLFLLTVFCFGNYVFKDNKNAVLTGVLSVLLLSLHMGISVFAYIRYYSFAPTMLAMVIYFFAAALFLRQLQQTLSLFKIAVQYLLIGLSVIAASVVHTQEAMFIAIMIGAMSLTFVAKRLVHPRFSNSVPPPVQTTVNAVTICVIAVAAFIALYAYSHLNLSRAPNNDWRLWEFGEGVGFWPPLTVLNLKNEFASVVTVWGGLVYLLFLLNIQRYRNNIFILAGMLSPTITFLNPFFIDVFLRHYNSTTVWRLCYLLPLHFVAADLLLMYAQRLRTSVPLQKTISAFALIGLSALLLPFNANVTRLPTLISSDPTLSHQHYSDLLDYLETLDYRESVLTDPMTGYMVSALTKHKSPRRKFFRSSAYKHFSFYDYSDNPLDRYGGYILIVNQREKSESRIGELSQHWTKDQWIHMSNYYPEALINHLADQPNRFIKIWSDSGISVFRITKN